MEYGHSGLTFHGSHSSTMNLKVMGTRRPLLPEIRDEYIDIPHRNGSILIPDNSAKDIVVEVDFLLRPPEGVSLHVAARNVGRWLWTNDRAPLIFDDDPGFYYNAKVTGNANVERIVTMGQFTIQFRCEPYQKEV